MNLRCKQLFVLVLALLTAYLLARRFVPSGASSAGAHEFVSIQPVAPPDVLLQQASFAPIAGNASNNSASAGGTPGELDMPRLCQPWPFSPPQPLGRAQLPLPENMYARVVWKHSELVQLTGAAHTLLNITLRVAVGPPRASDQRPALDSCSDLLSLFSNRTVVSGKVSYVPYGQNTNSSFDVLVNALVPCDAGDLQLFVALEWTNWGSNTSWELSNHRSVSSGQCVCWPPFPFSDQSDGWKCPDTTVITTSHNLLTPADAHVSLAACAGMPVTAPADLPLCRAPHDMFFGRWVVRPNETYGGLVQPGTGSLSVAVSNFLSVWDAAKPVFWQPHTCRLRELHTQEDALGVLRDKTVLLVGDSTLVEQFMILTEFLRHNSWTLENNDPKLREELRQAKIDKMRIFDSGNRLGPLTLRFLWNGGLKLQENSVGLRVFNDRTWLARLSAFAQPRPAKSAPTLLFLGSGLHDVSSKNRYFNFQLYRDQVRTALLRAMGTRAKVFWVAASPKFRGIACGGAEASLALGQPGVYAMNLIAKSVVEEVQNAALPPGQFRPVYLALDELRFQSPFEGDGIHCVRDYSLQGNWHGKKHFGSSCAWRAMSLMHLIGM